MVLIVAWLGKLRLGRARRGVARFLSWLGRAGQGSVRQVAARHGLVITTAGPSRAGRGVVWLGVARF